MAQTLKQTGKFDISNSVGGGGGPRIPNLEISIDDHVDSRTWTISTSEEQKTLNTDVNAKSMLYIENLNAAGGSGYLKIGFATGVYPLVLLPGRWGLVPIASAETDLFLEADTADQKVKIYLVGEAP